MDEPLRSVSKALQERRATAASIMTEFREGHARAQALIERARSAREEARLLREWYGVGGGHDARASANEG